MKRTQLRDGTKVFCLRAPEAKVLEHHVEGYLNHGIVINDGDIVFDVGANIGVLAFALYRIILTQLLIASSRFQIF